MGGLGPDLLTAKIKVKFILLWFDYPYILDADTDSALLVSYARLYCKSLRSYALLVVMCNELTVMITPKQV